MCYRQDEYNRLTETSIGSIIPASFCRPLKCWGFSCAVVAARLAFGEFVLGPATTGLIQVSLNKKGLSVTSGTGSSLTA
jgi:hypothetical protein